MTTKFHLPMKFTFLNPGHNYGSEIKPIACKMQRREPRIRDTRRPASVTVQTKRRILPQRIPNARIASNLHITASSHVHSGSNPRRTNSKGSPRLRSLQEPEKTPKITTT
ncbi:hypothetical protein M758_8G020300 [Ceratodon purpureus]|nr:hypothetical protein M758_8G020300 [Ceratodon purpureus]